MPFIGLSKSKFGRLTILGLAGTGPRGKSWNCLCICGNLIRLSTFKLEKGGYTGCGCTIAKSDKRQKVPRELAKKYSDTLVSWGCMLARCHYAKNKANCYKNIEICDRWYSFENFLEDMGAKPAKHYTIDRKDATKGYYKENCQWATRSENCRRVRREYPEERRKKMSEYVKAAHAEGKILTPEARRKIGKGAAKRVGRVLQACQECGNKAYLPICQQCRKTKVKE